MIRTKPFLAIISILFLLHFSVIAQVNKLDPNIKIPDHPRILLLKGEESLIKKNIGSDKTWQKMHQAILDECNVLVGLPPIERIQIGRRLLGKSREALRRLFFLSYGWRMTNEEKYLKRAEKELLAISAFSDWNPSHFLDVAEMTMAVSIGYDWLYKGLPERSRSVIKEAIIKKGIEPSLDAKYNSWLKVTNNWNQVCNAGMTYGALAIYEDQPKLAREIIDRAIESVVLSMEDYSPNGSYPEGYSYWGYGTSFNVMLISALEKAFGKDFGLSKEPGFLETAAYMENMTGPSNNSFNFSDSGLGGEIQPAMFWFANRLKEFSLLWVERSRMINNPTRLIIGNRLLPAIMIWGGGVKMDQITPPKEKVWAGEGKNPVVLMRTSWTDPKAIYVAMKGGSPSTNHAHMDIGSFIMEANGVRWAMDFGMQNYESLESKGVDLWNRSQNSQRWDVFRYNNFVHNTLTVDNQLQNVKGDAPLVSYSASSQFMNGVTDISSLYPRLKKSVRGIAIVNNEYVTVQDEVETGKEEATIRWTMLTPATVKIISNNQAELSKDAENLKIQISGSKDITMKTWTTEPPHDYDSPNPGTILVGFEIRVPANTKETIIVNLIPQSSKKIIVEKNQSLEKWPK
jgi:hypothetical protein